MNLEMKKNYSCIWSQWKFDSKIISKLTWPLFKQRNKEEVTTLSYCEVQGCRQVCTERRIISSSLRKTRKKCSNEWNYVVRFLFYPVAATNTRKGSSHLNHPSEDSALDDVDFSNSGIGAYILSSFSRVLSSFGKRNFT
jgi:hypothetical protein